MKYKRLGVFLETQSGIVYQVGLDKKQMNVIFDVISQLHGGVVKVSEKEYPQLEFTNRSNN